MAKDRQGRNLTITLAMLRGKNVLEKNPCKGYVVCSYNTMSETPFRNKDHAKLLRWHKEDRKVDNMFRHPADGSQWRPIDREFLEFAKDARNLRFALSTDGMNPFGE